MEKGLLILDIGRKKYFFNINKLKSRKGINCVKEFLRKKL